MVQTFLQSQAQPQRSHAFALTWQFVFDERNQLHGIRLDEARSPSLAVGLRVRAAARGRLELVADSRAGGDRGGSRRALKKYCQVWIVIWTQSDVLRAHCETRRSRSKQRVRLARCCSCSQSGTGTRRGRKRSPNNLSPRFCRAPCIPASSEPVRFQPELWD